MLPPVPLPDSPRPALWHSNHFFSPPSAMPPCLLGFLASSRMTIERKRTTAEAIPLTSPPQEEFWRERRAATIVLAEWGKKMCATLILLNTTFSLFTFTVNLVTHTVCLYEVVDTYRQYCIPAAVIQRHVYSIVRSTTVRCPTPLLQPYPIYFVLFSIFSNISSARRIALSMLMYL